MGTNEIISKVEELKGLEELAKEAAAAIESLRDELKQVMNDRNLAELEAGKYIIRYTTYQSDRFDTTRFKKDHGDLYRDYTKPTTSKRFTVSD